MIKKTFYLIIFILLSFSNSFAYDEIKEYDFEGLGNLSSGYAMPYNLADFSISQNSDVVITYEAFDCEKDNDFDIFIN